MITEGTESTASALLSAWYAGVSVGDSDALRRLIGEGFELDIAEGFPHAGRYRGASAVFDGYFAGVREVWRSMTPVVEEILLAGDRAIVLGRYIGVTRATATDFDVEFAHVWRHDGVLLLSLKQYADTAVLRDRIAGVSA